MLLDGWERTLLVGTQKWSRHSRQALVLGILLVAALLMVLAWIYHLKHRLSFAQAYGMSLVLVAVEFALNTWITRYSQHSQLFLPGQLAMISIVSGILVLAVLLLTVFRSEQNGLDWSAALGMALVLGGAVLLLRHQAF
jgi:hypothetical protein